MPHWGGRQAYFNRLIGSRCAAIAGHTATEFVVMQLADVERRAPLARTTHRVVALSRHGVAFGLSMTEATALMP